MTKVVYNSLELTYSHSRTVHVVDIIIRVDIKDI